MVGAGVAGLAAGARLRAAGLTVALLEAGPAIGGRVQTWALGGGSSPFDAGAHWFHDAERNPLAAWATRRGERQAPLDGAERVLIDGRPATEAELAEYDHARSVWEETVTERHRAGPDCSLAEAGAPLAGDPWLPTVEWWEGPIIAAADADRLSLADWHANALSGANHVVPGGLGALVRRLFASQPVALNTAVMTVEATQGGVVLGTAGSGTIEAAAAILTVSTACLARLRFAPALPPPHRNALDGLPMGAVTKLGFRAATPERFGLPPGSHISRRLSRRGEAAAGALFWSDAPDVLTLFVGGEAARHLSGAEAESFARAEILQLLGAAAARVFSEPPAIAAWAEEPRFGGAYAYARPGAAGARAELAAPLWDGRVRIAGEAVAGEGRAGTVGGAYASGLEAADFIIGRFTAPHARV